MKTYNPAASTVPQKSREYLLFRFDKFNYIRLEQAAKNELFYRSNKPSWN